MPGEEKLSHEYDANSRLTESRQQLPTNTTRVTTRPSSAAAPYNYNSADELEKGTGFTYSYNEVGQRTKTTPPTGSATTYGYDQAGNLISVERPKEGETAEDHRHLQLRRQRPPHFTDHLWHNHLPRPGTPPKRPRYSSPTAPNSYIYGPGGLPIEQISSGGTATYLHHDQQGATRLLTGSTGTVTGKCTYGAYGTPTCEGTTTTSLGYDGQYTSMDTGLIYLRARVYDPATAQFLSVDPLQSAARAPYTYAGDNPLSRLDPSGLVTVGICVSGEVALGIRVGLSVCGQVSYVRRSRRHWNNKRWYRYWGRRLCRDWSAEFKCGTCWRTRRPV